MEPHSHNFFDLNSQTPPTNMVTNKDENIVTNTEEQNDTALSVEVIRQCLMLNIENTVAHCETV